jgi:hypothetical protein
MQKNNNLELFSGSNCNYFYTNLPTDILQGITKTCEELRPHLTPTKILTKEGIKEDKSFRDNQSVAIPTYYWFAGMIWHYIMRVNTHNFNYDITCFGDDMIEFMSYEVGGHYKWHQDHTLYNYSKDTETIEQVFDQQHQFNRKISFSLLLNDDYEGGELQILKHPTGLTRVPKKAGTLVIFDSNCYHRVTKVREGRRDALVGWVIGPRWR